MEVRRAIIIDNGAGSITAGFSGRDAPLAIFPSVVGHFKDTSSMAEFPGKSSFVGDVAQSKREILNLNSPIEKGVITNWDDMEKIWHHTLYDELRAAPEEHYLLLTELISDRKEQRAKATEIMMEKFVVQGFYLAQQALLSLFASGRTTGVTLHSGHDLTLSVPIYEGHALPHATMRLEMGGKDLTDFMVKMRREKGHIVETRADWEITRDIKEKLSYIAFDYDMELADYERSSKVEKSYSLPADPQMNIGNERFRCPEPLFQPSILGLERSGIPDLVNSSLHKCDIDMRKEMFANIVLSGGNTLFEGISDRLMREIHLFYSYSIRIKVIAPPERKLSPWIGGSILSSLSTFPGMCISRDEYDESGSNVVNRLCF